MLFDIGNISDKKSSPTCLKKIFISSKTPYIFFTCEYIVCLLSICLQILRNTRIGKFKFPKIHLLKMLVIKKEQQEQSDSDLNQYTV